MQRHAFDVGTKGGDLLVQRLLGNGEKVLLLPYPGGLDDVLGGVAGAAGHFNVGGTAEYAGAVKAHAAQNRRQQQQKDRTTAALLLLFAGGSGSHGLFSFLSVISPLW